MSFLYGALIFLTNYAKNVPDCDVIIKIQIFYMKYQANDIFQVTLKIQGHPDKVKIFKPSLDSAPSSTHFQAPPIVRFFLQPSPCSAAPPGGRRCGARAPARPVGRPSFHLSAASANRRPGSRRPSSAAAENRGRARCCQPMPRRQSARSLAINHAP